MTDQQTPREAINKIMKDVAQQSYDRGAYGGWTDESTYYAPEDATDAVIRHIWDRAMSDEVVEDMAKDIIHYQQNVEGGFEVTRDYVWNVQFDDGQDEARREAKFVIRHILTAVIGPRPGEES